MRKFLLASCLLVVTACTTPPQPPKTPTQALVEARASLGTAVAAFNVYAAQRPFCGDAGAKPPPLCADRAVVIQGDRAAVDRLIEHPDVAALSFVGSTPVARAIYEGGTKRGKRVQALGGAKNHAVGCPAVAEATRSGSRQMRLAQPARECHNAKLRANPNASVTVPFVAGAQASLLILALANGDGAVAGLDRPLFRI